MNRTIDLSRTAGRGAQRTRALLGTVLGLCLAVRLDAADKAPQFQHFTAQPEPEAVLVSWTVPPLASCSRVVIRFQIDGPAPSSAREGSPLFDAPTSARGSYQARHERVSPQHVYAYAAFALNESGAVIASSTAVANPLPPGLPATVQNLRRADTQAAAHEGASDPVRR